jgi:CRP-like cAMP-binding protein
LRVRVHIDQKESILATLKQGDFFGEISLLDEGPRSADVIANQDSALLKISTASFYRLVKEAPAMATPFLLALSRSLVGRMRNLSKQYQDSIHLFRSLGE